MQKRSSTAKGASSKDTLLKQLVHGLSNDSNVEDREGLSDEVRHLIAVALGRQGGLKGGKARANKLTPKKRKAIAKKAAEARWGNRPKK